MARVAPDESWSGLAHIIIPTPHLPRSRTIDVPVKGVHMNLAARLVLSLARKRWCSERMLVKGPVVARWTALLWSPASYAAPTAHSSGLCPSPPTTPAALSGRRTLRKAGRLK
jgi:hypothetical protein